MTSVSPEQLGRLVQLQGLDIELRRLTAALDQVDQRVAALDVSLQGFISSMDAKESRIAELQQNYRSMEADVQDNAVRIQKSEEKLRSVKTNKEYQSGLKEIEDIKTKNATIEDSMIVCLEEIETVEQELSGSQADYEEQQRLLTDEKEAIMAEADRMRKRSGQLRSQRDEISRQISDNLLAMFHRVKSQQADGLAIVDVVGAVCQGCHMNIPPQMYNELQREDSLKMCPSCERIIYWKRTAERSE